MRVGISGPHYTLGPGDEWHFPDDEAVRLIEAGFADPVRDVPVERATPAVVTETAERKPVAERRTRKQT
jgi:hypothetical protein